MTTTGALVDGVSLTPLRFEMKRGVSNAKSSWSAREGVIVSVTSSGIAGVGEASPLPGFSPERLEDTCADLERARPRLASSSVPLEGSALDAIAGVLDPLGPLCPSARFALETALLDLRARLRGVPLWRELLGGRAPRPEPVPLSALLIGETAEELVRAAESAIERGISTGKLKIGRKQSLDREVDVAQAIRRAVGDGFRLRLDANGAFDVAEACIALDRFAPVSPELVEEPVAGERWLDLPAVGAGRRETPLGLDESGVGEAGLRLLEVLLARRGCDAIIVKLGLAGGFVAAAKVAALARIRAVPLVVTHMFEGQVATASAAAFALAHGSRVHAAGLDVSTYIDVVDTHPIRRDSIVATEAHGLGVVADVSLTCPSPAP